MFTKGAKVKTPLFVTKTLSHFSNYYDSWLEWLGRQRAVELHLQIGPVQDKVPNECRCTFRHKVTRRSNMALILTDEQQVVLKLSPRTQRGNPATVDGMPVWSSSDPAVLTVTPIATDPTGLSALAVAVGPLGTAQVQAVADADMSSGVRTLTAVLDVEVKAAEAVSLDITADAPTVQP